MLTLRPLNKKDISLVARWLYDKHASSWIESAEDWLAEIHDEDSVFTHIIAAVDDESIGYCRYRACGGFYNGEQWVETSPDFNEFDLDYLIGELEYVPKGFDRVMLDRMEDLLKEQGATCIKVTPAEGDEACCQLLESLCYCEEPGFYSRFL